MRLKKHLKDINRLQLLGIGLLVLIAAGFGLADLSDNLGGTCTASGCIPQGNFTGKMECNICSGTDHIFHLGLVQVFEYCSSTQIKEYRAGEEIGEHYRDEGCSYRVDLTFTEEDSRIDGTILYRTE